PDSVAGVLRRVRVVDGEQQPDRADRRPRPDVHHHDREVLTETQEERPVPVEARLHLQRDGAHPGMRTLVGARIKELWQQGGLLDAQGRPLGFVGPDARAHGRVTVQDSPNDTLHKTTSAPNPGPPYTYTMVRTLYARYNFVSDAEIEAAEFYE